MPFTVRMGFQDMEAYWKDICDREALGTLDKGEQKTFKKLVRAFHHLHLNPRYPSLNSHEIDPLSKIAGFKIWQSYLENNTPAAGCIYQPQQEDTDENAGPVLLENRK